MATRLTRAIGLMLAILLLGSYFVSAKTDEEIKKQLKEQLPMLHGSNNAGLEFWITFHPCWETNGPNNNVRIYVSCPVKTTVTLEIPALGIKRQQSTVPNDVVEFILPPTIAQMYSKTDGQVPKPERVWPGRGIHITSDQPIVCYGVTRYQYTSDGYLSLPVSSLGKKYIVASYADPTNNTAQWLPSYTSIIGIYDNTKVTFRLGGTESSRIQLESGDTMKVGQTVRKTLFPGDVWLIAGVGPNNDLTGSTIVATKNVAVISGNFCAYIPINNSACDFISEMEMPDNTWGTKYHVTPIVERLNYSIIKIFAKLPNTTIYRNNEQVAVIQDVGGIKGTGFLEQRTGGVLKPDGGAKPGPIVISSDIGKPINVVQYNPGQSEDGISSDPFQMNCTPIEQYQTEIVFNTPGIRGGYGFKRNYINFCYRATLDGGIPNDVEFGEVVNGEILWKALNVIDGHPGFPFKDVDANGRTFYSKTIKILYDGVYRIRAKDPFCAYAYGFADYDSYGFPTSTATADLEVPDTLMPSIVYEQTCDGFVLGTVTDEPVNDAEHRSNLVQPYLLPDSYNYFMTTTPRIIEAGTLVTAKWSLVVNDQSVDARAHIQFSDRAGNLHDTIVEYFAIAGSIKTVDGKYKKDYGTLKVETPNQTLTNKFVLKNEGSRDIPADFKLYLTLDTKEKSPDNPQDLYGSQGFEILGDLIGKNLAPLKKGESRTFDVKFTATAEGFFRDSIGVIVVNGSGDTCQFQFFARVTAFVGSPKIAATDFAWKDITVNARAPIQDFKISNKKSDGATTALKIYGLKFSDSTLIGHDDDTKVFSVIGLDLISPENPLEIPVDGDYTFQASFMPTSVNNFTSTITFLAEADQPKNYSRLDGNGIQPMLDVNQEDWNRKRADANFYKKDIPQGTTYPFTPYPSVKPEVFGTVTLTLKNDGTKLTVVSDIKPTGDAGIFFYKDDSGNMKDVVNDIYGLRDIFHDIPAGGQVERPIYFHPKDGIKYALNLEFVNTAGNSIQSNLLGTGLFPRMLAQKDYDFGVFTLSSKSGVSDKTAKTSSVWFRNLPHPYADVLNISDFVGTGNVGDMASASVIKFDKNNITYNGAKVSLPIALAVGDSILVPIQYFPTVAGDYSGTLTSVSDAEQEQTVNLIGTSITIETSTTVGSARICQKDPVMVTPDPTIQNNSSEEIKISNISFANVTGSTVTLTDLKILNSTTANLAKGAKYNVQIQFTPTSVYNNAKVYVIFDMANTVRNKTWKDTTSITLTSTYGTLNTYSDKIVKGDGNGKIVPGTANAVTYRILVKDALTVLDSKVPSYTFEVTYQNYFMDIPEKKTAALKDRIKVGKLLADKGFTVTSAQYIPVATDVYTDIISFTISGTTPIVNYGAGDVLAEISFDSFIAYKKDPTGTTNIDNIEKAVISHTAKNAENCYNFTFGNVTVERAPVCADATRFFKVASSSVFSLKSVNPSPVGSNGANVDFSIGFDVQTELRIYNSNGEIVDTPINEFTKAGDYTVRLPIEKLSSGTYFIKMTSGQFEDTKSFVIKK